MKLTDEAIDELLKSMELEEPSMSFTRNVMEQAKLEMPPVTLRTKVDKRIIYSIAAVFLCAITTTVGYLFTNSHLEYSISNAQLNFSFAMEKSTYSLLLKALLFADLIIALFYFDKFLRRNLNSYR
ncbi:hypothetical protein [Pedobacter frigoris]|uniref:Uncharacterized protein n=1 Tax=Pedobacter frigoris TaxID=2571272 RepID=A0A4U1CDF1_9SPHI|nr:hypothetical protein [Pedobacter frigoris]TKC04984.1 hypothetical protein FA047_14540 [Pedobacter frigoris]